jgi:hypothetical protein
LAAFVAIRPKKRFVQKKIRPKKQFVRLEGGLESGLGNSNPLVESKPIESLSQDSQSLKKKSRAGARDRDLDHDFGKSEHGSTASNNPKTQLYRRGKEVLGQNTGGMVKKLLDAKGGSIAQARAAIEMASEKASPREYIGAIIRKREFRTSPLDDHECRDPQI